MELSYRDRFQLSSKRLPYTLKTRSYAGAVWNRRELRRAGWRCDDLEEACAPRWEKQLAV
jgi:hypothetical protein